ncbi:MAG TPA: PAS domain S-box protein [Aestuariivirga sp.]|nr:PAS domain S-box protein [Aestuariivirga sp.]
MKKPAEAHELLHPNRGDLEDFFENAAVGLHIVDQNGLIVRANKAELAMLGYRAEEYIGRHISAFHMDPEVIADVLARLGRGEELIRFPARLRAADGSVRHGLVTSNGQFRDGKFVSTRCVTVDVTGEKLALESAHDSELRFQNMLESLPTPIYTTDAQGHLTFFNDAAAELAGRRPELGIDQWCITWRLYRPDGTPLPHDECPMAVALKEKRVVRGLEIIAERPDGSRARVIPYPTPLFDKNGELVGAINMLVDVSARFQTEQELARLGAVVASSEDAVIGVNLEGLITHWNEGAAQLYKYESHEMIGQPIVSIVPPELRTQEAEILEKLSQGERVKNYETERMGKDGRRVSISLSASSLRDEKGNVIGMTKVGRDITERKRAEQLQQLLLNELNHRVKNTLATVQAIAHQTVRSAKSPGDFATGFAARLQALSKAHNLLTQSSWQGADLLSLIREQLLDERISYTGPSVVLEPQVALHLSMVLHELGTNARKYGSLSVPRGRISLKWSVQATRANDDPTLLLKWQERDGPSVVVPTKQGFGTALIQQSIQAHGGDVIINYGPEGVSCEIKVPLSQEMSPKMKVYETPAIGSGSAGARETTRTSVEGKRILVVDDEPLLLMDLEDTLTNSGCVVVGPASTLPQAKVLIDEAGFDAALLDVNLGGQRVDDLAAALTQKNIPFAFVTGYGREGLPPSFRHAPLIGKPFSQQQLLEVVRQLVAHKTNVVHFGRSHN